MDDSVFIHYLPACCNVRATNQALISFAISFTALANALRLASVASTLATRVTLRGLLHIAIECIALIPWQVRLRWRVANALACVAKQFEI
jgi:hypothetical protein